MLTTSACSGLGQTVPSPEAVPDSAKPAEVSLFSVPTVPSNGLSHCVVSVSCFYDPPSRQGATEAGDRIMPFSPSTGPIDKR